jgi:putative tryptophan/tyrosine transport system substrate-binding protein
MRVRVALFILAILAAPLAAEAQQAEKMYRIGVLSSASPEWLGPLLAVFRQQLLAFGYADRQIVLEVRYARGRDELLPQLTGDLVRLKVDIIVTASSTPATLAAKQATAEIPIVMAGVGAPVETGLVTNIARPGGNITGSSSLTGEMAPKRLELIKELRPRATRVALLWNPNNPANAQVEKELRETASRAGLKLLSVACADVNEFDNAFIAITEHHPAALVVTGDPMHQVHMGRIIGFAARSRLPAIYALSENVLAGGLMSYGPSFPELYRRAAIYVDRILKGAKPADLPIEQPTRFQLVINRASRES